MGRASISMTPDKHADCKMPIIETALRRESGADAGLDRAALTAMCLCSRLSCRRCCTTRTWTRCWMFTLPSPRYTTCVSVRTLPRMTCLHVCCVSALLTSSS